MSTRSRVPLPVCNHQPAAYDGPSGEEILALRREYLNPGIFHFYKQPIAIVEGHMQYLWDEHGKQYLDAFAGIATVSVGHCHPKVTERLREQVGRIVHTTTIYLHPNVAQFAEALAKRMPAGTNLKQSYFTNSGSEANDVAMLMARLHTGNTDVLAVRNAYHGGSGVPMSLTAVGTWKYPVAPAIPVKHVAPGYCYRCPFGLEYPSCDVKCARSVEDTIRYETSGQVACFIGEPIQGVGGTVMPPKEYFQIVYEIVRKHGGVCIADEVQTGFGRTGEHYWGFENYGVTPDMVTMAKGIGNGAPLGACTTTPEIAATMTQRVHFNTFGGNPVSTLSGLATLEIIDEEQIQQNARQVGGYLKDKLLALQEKHALIGEVRGIGLMLGVELVKDRRSKEPATTETADLLEHAKERGLLLGKGGLFGNVLRIKPPMCITKADCDFLADCVDECLGLVSPA
ncbi:MAG: aspartate aminotransferase family protein [Planctomycetota bacterium]|nr:MAG: aspartate aminotransferase family protein [Planctomycetota bacterium]